MKNRILYLSWLFLFPVLTFAQHNANQQAFRNNNKTASPKFRTDYTDGYQQQQSINYGAGNEMMLGCSVLMNVKADSYLAIFNLTQVGSTAKETDEMLTARADAFIKSLASIGIPATDVYSDMIYLVPIFEYEVEKKLFSKTYNELPKGFEMQKNLHVRFKNSALIDDIVTLAASNEIYDLVTVEYFVKDSEAIYDTIRAQAVDFIAKNADRFKKLGLILSPEFKIVMEESGVVYPESQYSNYAAFVSQSLEAAKNKTVTDMRKPTTVAYDKLSYTSFDIVLNPQFMEPAVQFTYRLQIKYTLNKDALQPKNNYYILDAAGNLKQVFIK